MVRNWICGIQNALSKTINHRNTFFCYVRQCNKLLNWGQFFGFFFLLLINYFKNVYNSGLWLMSLNKIVPFGFFLSTYWFKNKLQQALVNWLQKVAVQELYSHNMKKWSQCGLWKVLKELGTYLRPVVGTYSDRSNETKSYKHNFLTTRY